MSLAEDPAMEPGETADDRTINLGRARRRKDAAAEPNTVAPDMPMPTQPMLPSFQGIAMESWVANLSGRFEFSGMLATAREWHDMMNLDRTISVVVKCKVSDVKHALGYTKDWDAKAGREVISLKAMEITGVFPEGQEPG